ncbi:unnamed protein product [Cuscuta europaea]|uniref:Uncharacterized protein n=1 Tax=Cuscuta europaea TaxID=41803 RepID=A0A9P0YMJ4_CUSEU|nr:unnamed protein product [Cuscuta europaea]
MDFRDNTKPASVPPLGLIYSGYSGKSSAEDLAWADSCLCPDAELSQGGLNSFGNAFAFLGIHGSKLNSSFEENGEFRETGERKFFLNKKGRNSQVLDEITTCDPLRNEQEGLNMIDYDQISETSDTFNTKFDLDNVFLPTYNENQMIFATVDPELDSIFPAFVEDQPADNIFKVWELDIPDEEDELIGQVKIAVAESALEPEAAVSKCSGVWIESDASSLDDLISGIDDLSLSRESS